MQGKAYKLWTKSMKYIDCRVADLCNRIFMVQSFFFTFGGGGGRGRIFLENVATGLPA